MQNHKVSERGGVSFSTDKIPFQNREILFHLLLLSGFLLERIFDVHIIFRLLEYDSYELNQKFNIIKT